MSNKSTWWSVTAYSAEISLLESNEFPEFVGKVFGGREACPTTGREHFQGAIQCRRQVRLAQLKQWLPTAHLEPARDRLALRRYVMKEETAVGPKVSRENDVQQVSVKQILLRLAGVWDEDEYIRTWNDVEDAKKAFEACYWHCVRQLLRDVPSFREVPHLFARSDVVTVWRHTRSVWTEVIEEGGYSITPPTNVVEGDLAEEFSQHRVHENQNE